MAAAPSPFFMSTAEPSRSCAVPSASPPSPGMEERNFVAELIFRLSSTGVTMD